jgi:hypothetical protein
MNKPAPAPDTTTASEEPPAPSPSEPDTIMKPHKLAFSFSLFPYAFSRTWFDELPATTTCRHISTPTDPPKAAFNHTTMFWLCSVV